MSRRCRVSRCNGHSKRTKQRCKRCVGPKGTFVRDGDGALVCAACYQHSCLGHGDQFLLLSASQISLDTLGTEDYVGEYGFKERSKQYNFFNAKTASRRVGILYSGDAPPPSHMADARVICRVFGEMIGNNFLIWHLSTRRAHPLNDSMGGTIWGHRGLTWDSEKKRWFHGETQLSKRNAERFVAGTPNPFAVQCLVKLQRHLEARNMEQYYAMPCTKLFDKNYNQKYHPSIMLIYRALGFVYVEERYVWHGTPDMADSYRLVLEAISKRISAVTGSP